MKDKSWSSLKPVLVEMLTQDPGFRAVTTLFSDKESALSRDNVAQLRVLVPRLKRVIRFHPSQGKAFMAERHIRTFKRVLSAVLRRSGARSQSLRHWRSFTPDVVRILNFQR